MHDGHFDYITKSLKETLQIVRCNAQHWGYYAILLRKTTIKAMWYALLTNNLWVLNGLGLSIWLHSLPMHLIWFWGLCEVGVDLEVHSTVIYKVTLDLGPSLSFEFLFHPQNCKYHTVPWNWVPVHKVCVILFSQGLNLLKEISASSQGKDEGANEANPKLGVKVLWI